MIWYINFNQGIYFNKIIFLNYNYYFKIWVVWAYKLTQSNSRNCKNRLSLNWFAIN